jgi:hypothetical protein
MPIINELRAQLVGAVPQRVSEVLFVMAGQRRRCLAPGPGALSAHAAAAAAAAAAGLPTHGEPPPGGFMQLLIYYKPTQAPGGAGNGSAMSSVTRNRQ